MAALRECRILCRSGCEFAVARVRHSHSERLLCSSFLKGKLLELFESFRTHMVFNPLRIDRCGHLIDANCHKKIKDNLVPFFRLASNFHPICRQLDRVIGLTCNERERAKPFYDFVYRDRTHCKSLSKVGRTTNRFGRDHICNCFQIVFNCFKLVRIPGLYVGARFFWRFQSLPPASTV